MVNRKSFLVKTSHPRISQITQIKKAQSSRHKAVGTPCGNNERNYCRVLLTAFCLLLSVFIICEICVICGLPLAQPISARRAERQEVTHTTMNSRVDGKLCGL